MDSIHTSSERTPYEHTCTCERFLFIWGDGPKEHPNSIQLLGLKNDEFQT